MKKKLTVLTAIIMSILSSCVDTTELENRIDKIDERITALQNEVGRINDDIVLLNKLLNDDLVIVGVEEIMTDDGQTVKGYALEFKDGSTMEVTFGADYQAAMPTVRVSEDGYWEVSFDGGKYFETLGKVNHDGSAPSFLIDSEGFWTVSFGGGYERILDANGEEINALDPPSIPFTPIFESISYDESRSVMTFKLTEGQTIEVPVIDSFYIRVMIGGKNTMLLNETRTFEVEHGDVAEVIIKAPEGWNAKLLDNRISVTAPGSGEKKEYTFEMTAVSTHGYIKTGTFSLSLNPVRIDDMAASSWNRFLADSDDNILLDYSYAGYAHGERAPVEHSGYKIYDITDYGAVPDDGKSDREAFLAMVKAATGQDYQDNGGNIAFGSKDKADAVLYFPEGEFILHNAEDDVEGVSKTIVIRSGNIILKGAGRDRTRILMDAPCQPTDPDILYSSPTMLEFKHFSTFESFGTPATVTSASAKGSFSVTISSTAGMSAGDYVCLHVKNADADFVEAELTPAPYNDDPHKSNWDIVKNGVEVVDYHQIASIENNKVTFKEPIMHDVTTGRGWEIKKYHHYSEVGIEDLTFVGKAKKGFGHHASWEDDGAYKPLGMNRLTNSWIRRVGFENTSEACSIVSCANVSAYDIIFTGNRGHASVRSQASSRVFIGATDDRTTGYLTGSNTETLGTFSNKAGNYHAVGVSRHAMGTVLWRNTWGEDSCFESHATQPRATLIDCCDGGWMSSRQGGDETQAPSHLDDLTIWNFHAGNANLSGTDFISNSSFSWWDKNSTHWKFLPPVVVGFHGPANTRFDATQCKFIESEGSPVYPESLYEAQLQKRLGYVPAWLEMLK